MGNGLANNFSRFFHSVFCHFPHSGSLSRALFSSMYPCGPNKELCPISRTWTLLQWPVVCKNKVLIGVSLCGFGNPGWGYYLRFVFYRNGSIVNLILQVFLAKREGLFNLCHFLGDISRLRVAFTANVNVRFKLRNSHNRKWTKLIKTAWFMKQFLCRKLA